MRGTVEQWNPGWCLGVCCGWWEPGKSSLGGVEERRVRLVRCISACIPSMHLRRNRLGWAVGFPLPSSTLFVYIFNLVKFSFLFFFVLLIPWAKKEYCLIILSFITGQSRYIGYSRSSVKICLTNGLMDSLLRVDCNTYWVKLEKVCLRRLHKGFTRER